MIVWLISGALGTSGSSNATLVGPMVDRWKKSTVVDTRKWWWSLAIQFVLVSGAIWLYFVVRGLTEGRAERSFRHARRILQLESTLWFDIEQTLQEWILNHDLLVTFANWVYIWGHWPVIISTLIWLFARHRPDYILLRNAIFISGAIGLVIFALYPVAPPRLLPGFVDTVTERSDSYRLLQPPSLVNRYAAVPSLHFGWNLIVGISIYRVARSRATIAYAIAGPVLMVAAIVLTANHFILDAIAGGMVALIGYWAARIPAQYRQRAKPQSAAFKDNALIASGDEPDLD